MNAPRQYHYAFSQEPGETTLAILGELPERWGRMVPLARGVLVESGRTLQQKGLLEKGRKQNEQGRSIGLIGASRHGSLATDQDFARGLKLGYSFASPALFGYTLANIPLAEAANHFGLTGPVYGLLESDSPLETATEEAHRLLDAGGIDCMLACSFDTIRHHDHEDGLEITFTLVN
ncbi:MAG: beta-ketoacyl synthase N-terminal-like domain-containing protein [Thermodesulfobacteriota bacterium]